MSKLMMIGSIVLWSLSCLVVYTHAAKVVNISHTSQGSTDFYLKDEVTFTCAAAGFSSIESLTLVYNDFDTARAGCRYDGSTNRPTWGPRGEPFIGDVDGLDSPQLTPEYCDSVGKVEGFSISVKVRIADAAVRGKFFCRLYDWTDTIISREISVTSVKVAPENLTMSAPEEVVEGEEFDVKCESTGGDPAPSFKYEIKRSGAVVATGGTYTPTVPDREGFTITCTDTAHHNWKGGNTMMTSEEVKPKYIGAVGDLSLSAGFNPSYTNELNCADYVTGNPLPDTFGWTQRGSRLEETSSTLNLAATSGETEDTVTCVASNGLEKNVIITWSITWSSDVTTTVSGATVAAVCGSVVTYTTHIIIFIIIYGAVC